MLCYVMLCYVWMSACMYVYIYIYTYVSKLCSEFEVMKFYFVICKRLLRALQAASELRRNGRGKKDPQTWFRMVISMRVFQANTWSNQSVISYNDKSPESCAIRLERPFSTKISYDPHGMVANASFSPRRTKNKLYIPALNSII